MQNHLSCNVASTFQIGTCRKESKLSACVRESIVPESKGQGLDLYVFYDKHYQYPCASAVYCAPVMLKHL